MDDKHLSSLMLILNIDLFTIGIQISCVFFKLFVVIKRLQILKDPRCTRNVIKFIDLCHLCVLMKHKISRLFYHLM